MSEKIIKERNYSLWVSSWQRQREKKSINKGRGALTIVGSGIQAVRQFTVESQQAIKQADKVLFVIPDPITEMWIKKLSPNSESLANFYVECLINTILWCRS